MRILDTRNRPLETRTDVEWNFEIDFARNLASFGATAPDRPSQAGPRPRPITPPRDPPTGTNRAQMGCAQSRGTKVDDQSPQPRRVDSPEPEPSRPSSAPAVAAAALEAPPKPIEADASFERRPPQPDGPEAEAVPRPPRGYPPRPSSAPLSQPSSLEKLEWNSGPSVGRPTVWQRPSWRQQSHRPKRK